jgi:hypothetical protein
MELQGISTRPGASEEALTQLEEHLGIALPAFYRALLKQSNGFDAPEFHVETFWGTEDIEWFSVANSNWIDLYARVGPDGDLDEEYGDLYGMLQISSGDDAVVLLNPAVKDEFGEWEAILFASWIPGAERLVNLREFLCGSFEGDFWPDGIPFGGESAGTAAGSEIKPPLFWASKSRDAYLEQLKLGNRRARLQAINALAFHRCEDDISVLAACLSDEDEAVQVSAARFLRKFEVAPAVQALVEATLTGRAVVKLEAAESLLAMQQEFSVDSLRAIGVELQGPTEIAYRASRILGQRPSLVGVEALAETLKYWVVHRGYEGLNPLGTIVADLGLQGGLALPAIKEFLEVDDSRVRLQAVAVLRFIETSEANKLLKRAEKDQEQEVRAAAQKILKGRVKSGLFGWLGN